jgi:MFS family permease
MGLASDSPPDEPPHAKRNFLLLAWYQIMMRTGWVFKTESIIMPAVLDTLSQNSAWMRGALPLLNRLGQSAAPILVAQWVRRRPRKKWVCVVSVALMSLAFAGMSAIWLLPGFASRPAAPLVYLALYSLFFICLGINQMSQFTLQGKLIEVTSRGRLMSLANGIGSASSVVCALFLLPLFLRKDSGDFDRLFGFTAILFAVAAIIMTLLREPADEHATQPQSYLSPWALAWQAIAKNRAFRRTTIVAILYGSSSLVFPHYQTLAQNEFGPDLRRLIWWVVIQNVGTGLFSIPIGMLADRFGTRLVMRIVMLGVCATPPVAIFLSHAQHWGPEAYSLVFLLIGLNPLALRMFSDYTLEVSPQRDHPQYLSTMSLCISLPILFSLPAGWCIDRFGFPPVFYFVTGLNFLGWLLTFGLSEPRQRMKNVEISVDSSDSANG